MSARIYRFPAFRRLGVGAQRLRLAHIEADLNFEIAALIRARFPDRRQQLVGNFTWRREPVASSHG